MTAAEWPRNGLDRPAESALASTQPSAIPGPTRRSLRDIPLGKVLSRG